MGSDPNASGLKSLTTDELKRLWVEACRSWAASPDAEPAGIADVEAELDFRNEGWKRPIDFAEYFLRVLNDPLKLAHSLTKTRVKRR